MLNAGWAHDTRDNIMYPNKGVFQRINLEVGLPGLDLQYYKADYKHSWYEPLTNNLTLMLNGEVGYGGTYGNKNTEFPFFKNYYMGGVNSLRGFQQSSVGNFVVGQNGFGFFTGGTKRVLGNAEIFFPVPGLKDSSQFRLSTFIDAGNIYTAEESMSLGDLRYSAGLGVSWFSPFGPIKVVLAKPLNSVDTDRTQFLQFQMGQQF
jgi:outer membrane protein insertion porin family